MVSTQVDGDAHSSGWMGAAARAASRLRLCAAAFLVVAQAMPLPAQGVTIINPNPGPGGVVTVGGTFGGDGTTGAPNSPGGPGGDGGDATATAVSTNPHNEARVNGGWGGVGGAAGPATPPNPVSAPGGAGGSGGWATGTAQSDTSASDQDASAVTRATGGTAGRGGNGADLGIGGTGGAATSDAEARSASGDADALATSQGGAGGLGQPGGSGGDATARAAATGASESSVLRATAEATAGVGGAAFEQLSGNPPDSSGGRGGDASSQARAESNVAAGASASSSAHGGNGGNAEDNQLNGGDGGGAVASAFASAAGSQEVSATALAEGGTGGAAEFGSVGRSGLGGSATATARGVSLGGGQVVVEATQRGGTSALAWQNGNGGADSIGENLVSGSTSGTLELHQVVEGGGGGSRDGLHRAGDATSILDGRNEAGGALVMVVEARGGQGVPAPGPFDSKAFGGNASVDAHATDASGAPIDVSASAFGGVGGGIAHVVASGESSAGGDVSVRAYAENGIEGGSEPTRVIDAVSGSTTGNLVLSQTASGGPAGIIGRSAETGLHVVDSQAASLTVGLEALGATNTDYGVGGDGRILASSVEHTGAANVSLSAAARGGGAYGSPGGHAEIQSLYARSGSGNVTIEAEAQDGGRNALVLDNAIDGDTSGDLTLSQAARGTTGNVTSALERNKALAALALSTLAVSSGAAAIASSQGSNSAGGLTLTARAIGALGATASGSGTAAGDVTLTVDANSISGIALPIGTSAGLARIESARGVSTGGGAVRVAASLEQGPVSGPGVPGRSAELLNVADGETTGALQLEQHAFGGQGARGGDARSVLERSDTRSDLELVDEAVAGFSTFSQDGADAEAISNARNDGGNAVARARAVGGGGNTIGGDARATATARALGDVEVYAEARAGGDGSAGSAELVAVSGISDGGGAVSVTGVQGAEYVWQTPGAGASVSLRDAIHGETTGFLTLRQRAEGGTSQTGAGGRAESVLTRSVDADALKLTAEAVAGGNYLATAAGGDASARVQAENTRGSVDALGLARGGSGMSGGSAELHVEALGHEDGAAVRIRGPSFEPSGPQWGAFGGHIDTSQSRVGSQDPGRATSESIGRSLGDAEVTVFDRAVGGFGPHDLVSAPPSAPIAMGGAASSTAQASGAGASRVEANASAHGGDGGRVIRETLPLDLLAASAGGAADASSHATGLGEVHAFSDATAGLSFAGTNGSASALANADGAWGDVGARASSSIPGVSQLSVGTSARIDGSASASARVDAGTPFFARQAATSSSSPDVTAAASLHPMQHGSDTIADVSFAAAPGAGAGSQLSASFALAFDQKDELFADDVAITFANPHGAGSGLESLRLSVFVDDLLVLDHTAYGLEEAIAFLDGLSIRPPVALDALPDPELAPPVPPSLRLDLAWLSSESAWSFDVQMRAAAEVVPEPGTALLLALGLAWLGTRRARQRRG